MILNFFAIAVFAVLMIVFYIIGLRRKDRRLRDIPAYYRLRGTVETAVEDGTRIHIAIGRGDVLSPRGASAMVGLSLLRQIAMVASESDHPPLATSGDGLLGILSQDTLRAAYNDLNLKANFDPTLGRVTGITPLSYGAGAMPMIFDESISANLMIGSFGYEAALIASAGERSQTRTLAGTDNLTGQAILYAAAHEPLIGEEIFAGGAYMEANPMHEASLHTQDIVRWAVIGLVTILSLVGLVQGLVQP